MFVVKWRSRIWTDKHRKTTTMTGLGKFKTEKEALKHLKLGAWGKLFPTRFYFVEFVEEENHEDVAVDAFDHTRMGRPGKIGGRG